MPKAIYSTKKGLYQEAGAGIVIEKGAATISGTTATLNSVAGILTTPSLTTAAGAQSAAYTITNSYVEAGKQVLLSVQYNGTVGSLPYAAIETIGAGSFVFRVSNIKAAGASLDAVVKVHFLVI